MGRKNNYNNQIPAPIPSEPINYIIVNGKKYNVPIELGIIVNEHGYFNYITEDGENITVHIQPKQEGKEYDNIVNIEKPQDLTKYFKVRSDIWQL